MKIDVQRKMQMSKTTAGDVSSRRRGSILLIVYFSLFMMLGFCALAVDYGTSVVVKNQLQRTCDAAALAGAAELTITKVAAIDRANATTQAIETARENNITITSSNISFSSDSLQIRVSVVLPRKFLFGAVIGIPNGQVPATALAGLTYVSGFKGLDPLGVTRQTYERYVPREAVPVPGVVNLQLTRNTKEQFGPLNQDAATLTDSSLYNVAALDLRPGNSGNSGAQFQTDVATANNDTQVKIGDIVDPLGSSITSQGADLVAGIQARINKATQAPWSDVHQYEYINTPNALPDYPDNDPRIIYILVSDDGYAADNSNPKLTLAYFAPVYIEKPVSYTKGGNTPTAILTVRFLPGVLRSTADGLILSNNTVDTGVKVVRLLD